ncbi:adenylosuccinate lyase [Thomasclavelia ramosa DSM 1402]|uniref:Adenylosuccinate lyase n=3 Tax=Thomasclavelia TaxID=3025755 RepID=B0N5L3_9FIRM|nr:adenylosuccinate lyase [Thomasclavelia ramosa DSM 1402]
MENRMEKQEFECLTLCPLDGRYSGVKDALGEYFSEYALVKYRVFVEIQWLKFLIENVESDVLAKFDLQDMDKLTTISSEFNYDSFARIKEIENTTRHDVKAVEYFIDEKVDALGFGYLQSFVHIGCTSEDINNTSYACMLKYGLKDVWLPKAKEFAAIIDKWAEEHSNDAMLAHTHGQPATPTTIGKEFKVYAYRFLSSIENVEAVKIKAKFNGATGNYSAILTAFPNEDWQVLAKKFVEEYLGLTFNPLTTQIESHDYTCHILDGIRHFNNVLVDFDVDMWLYISMEYFKQIPVKGEVGSSTMPHKVNPIRFENSEANIDMSNNICIALSNKLPKSRMQRDLSDSSSQRNLGLAFGYSLQAINETMNGLAKCVVNKDKLASDLNEKWEVLAEPIQTMLRKYGVPDAYDTLKALTRGKSISKEDILKFAESLDILSDQDRQTLVDMTPASYIGLAKELAKIELNK